jgi:hypothetical protein
MDGRFPRYLRVRVDFPLAKSLLPSLTVKIKERGPMVINLKYENVLHFCFRCGRISHALAICHSGIEDEGFVRFGEELRASPPRRVREINLKTVAPRVIKPLFQVAGMQTRDIPVGGFVDGQHTGSQSSGEGSRRGKEGDTTGGSRKV